MRAELADRIARIGPKIERWFRERDAELPAELAVEHRKRAVDQKARGLDPSPVLWSDKLAAFKTQHGEREAYRLILAELDAGRAVRVCCEVMLETDRPCPIQAIIEPLFGKGMALEKHQIIELKPADLGL